MGIEKFVERLEKPEVTEIVAPPDKVEVVASDGETANEPDSAPEPSDTDKELSGINNTLAELRGEVKASPAIVQGEQILHTLEELKSRLDKLEAEIEAAKCPECGKIVGWHDLEVKQSIKPSYFPVFDLPPFIKPDMESYKQCPACGYKEEVEEE